MNKEVLFGCLGLYSSGYTQKPAQPEALRSWGNPQKAPTIHLQVKGEALFSEGHATTASSIVCPDAPDLDYLWFGLSRNDWIAECDSKWIELRKLLLRDLEIEDQDTYRTYFFGDTADDSIPVRSGYYAGFRAVRFLNSFYSIVEMSEWSRDRVHAEIKQALQQS